MNAESLRCTQTPRDSAIAFFQGILNNATRITLVLLFRLINWRAVLTIVQLATMIRWHHQGI